MTEEYLPDPVHAAGEVPHLTPEEWRNWQEKVDAGDILPKPQADGDG